MIFKNRIANFLWWRIVLRSMDFAARISSRRASSEKVLVAYPARVGDSVMWLDAARAVREIYPAPRWHITLLADPSFAPLAATQPQFDSVWEFDRGRYSGDLRYRSEMNRKIADAGFRVVLNPAPWPDQYNVDSLVSVTRAPNRIGWRLRSPGDSRAVRLMRNWRASRYTTTFTPPMPGTSMLRHHESFVRELGLASYAAQSPSLAVDPNRAPKIPAAFFVLCPGAAEDLKRWPVANFARLAENISTETGLRAVICGAVNEVALVRELCSTVNTPVLDLAGQLNLVQLAALFANAALVIANDSGSLHLAAASGARSLCVLGGGTFAWCMPYDVPPAQGCFLPAAVWHEMDCYGCDWRCVFNPPSGESAPCLKGVAVERVAAEALKILAEARGAHEIPAAQSAR